jgi:hypothetical protein
VFFAPVGSMDGVGDVVNVHSQAGHWSEFAFGLRGLIASLQADHIEHIYASTTARTASKLLMSTC